MLPDGEEGVRPLALGRTQELSPPRRFRKIPGEEVEERIEGAEKAGDYLERVVR